MEYAEDLNRYLGFVLPHDDTVNDRSPGSRLCNAQDRTEQLWKGLCCKTKSLNQLDN